MSSVVTATASVIGQFGFDRATIGKIADKAGVSVGSIYQYFSSKESIFASFATNSLNTNRNIVLEKLREWRELPLAESIPRLIDHMVAHWENNSATARHVFAHASVLGIRGIHMRMRREVIAAVAELLEHHKKELRITDCEKSAAVVIHAAVAVITAKFMDPELPYSSVDLKNEVSSMIMRYLLTSEGLS